MSKPKDYPLVQITWIDSSAIKQVWHSGLDLDDEIKAIEKDRYYSSGYLIATTKLLYVLASSLHTDANGDVTNFGGVFTIPKGCVMGRIKRLG